MCMHSTCSYSFAIVGINITGLALQLLNQGHLKTHFYNAVQGRPRLEHFHQLYCKYQICVELNFKLVLLVEFFFVMLKM